MATSTSAFMAQCRERLIGKIELHRMMWCFGDHKACSVDLVAGSIRFEFASGQVVTAQMQVIGTYDTTAGTFRWGWADPGVSEALRKHAQIAHAWGSAHNLPLFTEHAVACTQEDALSFLAVARQVCGAECAFSAPVMGSLVFVTFGEVEIDLRAIL